MNLPQLVLQVDTFGSYAHQAIATHVKKSIKHEADVLKDQDAEPLHQMRVGMRRLRTTLEVFAPAVELPKALTIRRIRKIARVLGAVRDLDVLKAELNERYRPRLKDAEQRQIDDILAQVSKQRHKAFSKLEDTLSSKSYQAFKHSTKAWLREPTYTLLGPQPLVDVLPDLLLPLIAQLLLQPGWQVGRDWLEEASLPSQPTAEQLSESLEQQGDALHRLRKVIKLLRYQTELFVDFYGSDYAAQLDDFQAVQQTLGQLQDSLVLTHFLQGGLKSDLQPVVSSLMQQIQQEHLGVWRRWQPIQQRYLNPDFRLSLRRQMLEPLNKAHALV